jgi:glycosyltransferase involved in cell wall biosynthesis
VLHTFDFYSNVMGVPAGRLAGTPVIVASQRDLGNLRPRIQRRVHVLALRWATHVLVNSPAIAERLRQNMSTKPGRIAIVRNGVDLARFSPAPRRERGSQVLIGTLANLRPEKGLSTLVEAAALVCRRAPQARFVIWGDGSLRSALDALIRRHRLTNIVELAGSTSEPETELRRCEIVVLPSLSEASSNVILEAMATGLPVVATCVGGTPALVDDQQTGLLVPPGDPRALADALLRLLEDPALRAQLGARGHDRARREFGMDRMLAQIEALYREALGDQVLPTVRTGAVQGV